MERIGEGKDYFFDAWKSSVEVALKGNFRLDSQTPQAIRLAVGKIKDGTLTLEGLTPEVKSSLEKAGGTDHPDPTLRSDPTRNTFASFN